MVPPFFTAGRQGIALWSAALSGHIYMPRHGNGCPKPSQPTEPACASVRCEAQGCIHKSAVSCASHLPAAFCPSVLTATCSRHRLCYAMYYKTGISKSQEKMTLSLTCGRQIRIHSLCGQCSGDQTSGHPAGS